ncbi:hypothetical protein BGY98DRAFT_1018166 [Russula aff. rugulosa BPL654]|nr:hypothetical protein BGY98DRAFT_1018166 [Russula aff. rugulosa BPL654]
MPIHLGVPHPQQLRITVLVSALQLTRGHLSAVDWTARINFPESSVCGIREGVSSYLRGGRPPSFHSSFVGEGDRDLWRGVSLKRCRRRIANGTRMQIR